MYRYFKLNHYALSESFYRSADDLNQVHGACGFFEEVAPEHVPMPPWPGAKLEHVKEIDAAIALDLITS